MSNYQELKEICKANGYDEIGTYFRPLIKLTGSLEAAAFLTQCVYWSDKTKSKVGFYKSSEEWLEETGLTREKVERIRKQISKYVTTRLKRANNAPTLHYQVNMKVLLEDIRLLKETLISDLDETSKSDLDETSKSLTKTTRDYSSNNFSKIEKLLLCDQPGKPDQPEITGNNQITTTQEIKTMEKDEYLKSLEQTLNRSLIKAGSQTVDLHHYPEDVRPYIDCFCKLWNFRPPTQGKKNGAIAYWIKSTRELMDACGEFGITAIEGLRKEFEQYMGEHNGIAPFLVSSPGSITNSCRRKAAEMRASITTQQPAIKRQDGGFYA